MTDREQVRTLTAELSRWASYFDQAVGVPPPLDVAALRLARQRIELLAPIPEADRAEVLGLLDSAEVLRRRELAAQEVMAVPLAREPRRAW
jgi:hypothetical protein